MDFVSQLSSRAFLGDLHKDFLHNVKLGTVSADLNQLPFNTFVTTCMMRLRLNGLRAGSFGRKLTERDFELILCGLFDRIDIDSKGFISWDDFTSHVLRAGKIHFKPVTVKDASLEFRRSAKMSKPLAARSMWYLDDLNTLFVFEKEAPGVRLFDDSLQQVDRFKPLDGVDRLRHVEAQKVLPYYGQQQKARTLIVSTVDESSLRARATVLAMAFLPLRKQIVVSTSDGLLTFWNTKLDFMFNHCECPSPQSRLLYLTSIDVLLGWHDNMSNGFNVWDTRTAELIYRFNVHGTHIYDACEVASRASIVSADIQGNLIMWSLAPVKHLMIHGKRETSITKDLLQESIIDIEEVSHTVFKGHYRGVCSLRYAADYDLILAAGFDFEACCFDPDASSVHMRFRGHGSSVMHVETVRTPIERGVTADLNRVIKIWSLDRGQGGVAECLQSLTMDADASPIVGLVVTNHGSSIVALQQRLNKVSLELVTSNRAIPNGLMVSARLNRVWAFGADVVVLTELSSGIIVKNIHVIEVDNIDVPRAGQSSASSAARRRPKKPLPQRNPDGSKKPERTPLVPRDDAAARVRGSGTLGSMRETVVQGISLSDKATAVTSDLACKKFFVGTIQGRVLLMDSGSLGIMGDIAEDLNLTADAVARRGAVVSLHYDDAAELLTVVFSSGTVLVVSGVLASKEGTMADPQINPGILNHTSVMVAPPGYTGGKPPRHPRILRNLREFYEGTKVMCGALSPSYECLAVATSDGTIRLFHYRLLTMLAALSTPAIDTGGQDNLSVVPVATTSMTFAPLSPMLIVGDAQGRISLFFTKPMTPAWIFTWYAVPLVAPVPLHPGQPSTLPSSPVIRSGQAIGVVKAMLAPRGCFTAPHVRVDGETRGARMTSDVETTSTSAAAMESDDRSKTPTSRGKDAKTKTVDPNEMILAVVAGCERGQIVTYDLSHILAKVNVDPTTSMAPSTHANASKDHRRQYGRVVRASVTDGLSDFEVGQLTSSLRNPIGKMEYQWYDMFGKGKGNFSLEQDDITEHLIGVVPKAHRSAVCNISVVRSDYGLRRANADVVIRHGIHPHGVQKGLLSRLNSLSLDDQPCEGKIPIEYCTSTTTSTSSPSLLYPKPFTFVSQAASGITKLWQSDGTPLGVAVEEARPGAVDNFMPFLSQDGVEMTGARSEKEKEKEKEDGRRESSGADNDKGWIYEFPGQRSKEDEPHGQTSSAATAARSDSLPPHEVTMTVEADPADLRTSVPHPYYILQLQANMATQRNVRRLRHHQRVGHAGDVEMARDKFDGKRRMPLLKRPGTAPAPSGPRGRLSRDGRGGSGGNGERSARRSGQASVGAAARPDPFSAFNTTNDVSLTSLGQLATAARSTLPDVGTEPPPGRDGAVPEPEPEPEPEAEPETNVWNAEEEAQVVCLGGTPAPYPDGLPRAVADIVQSLRPVKEVRAGGDGEASDAKAKTEYPPHGGVLAALTLDNDEEKEAAQRLAERKMNSSGLSAWQSVLDSDAALAPVHIKESGQSTKDMTVEELTRIEQLRERTLGTWVSKIRFPALQAEMAMSRNHNVGMDSAVTKGRPKKTVNEQVMEDKVRRMLSAHHDALEHMQDVFPGYNRPKSEPAVPEKEAEDSVEIMGPSPGHSVAVGYDDGRTSPRLRPPSPLPMSPRDGVTDRRDAARPRWMYMSSAALSSADASPAAPPGSPEEAMAKAKAKALVRVAQCQERLLHMNIDEEVNEVHAAEVKRRENRHLIERLREGRPDKDFVGGKKDGVLSKGTFLMDMSAKRLNEQEQHATSDVVHTIHGRTRYGPYRIRDIYSYMNLLRVFEAAARRAIAKVGDRERSRAGQVMRQLLEDSKGLDISGLPRICKDENFMYSLEEICHTKTIRRDPTMYAIFSRKRTERIDGVIERYALTNIFFAHASGGERHRINTLVSAREAMVSLIETIRPASNKVEKRGRAGAVLAKGISRSGLNTSPTAAMDKLRRRASAKGTTHTPKSVSSSGDSKGGSFSFDDTKDRETAQTHDERGTGKREGPSPPSGSPRDAMEASKQGERQTKTGIWLPHATKLYEGFVLDSGVFMAAKKLADQWHHSDDGTVSVQDIVEIFWSVPQLGQCEAIAKLDWYILNVLEIKLYVEVDSEVLHRIMIDGCHLKVE